MVAAYPRDVPFFPPLFRLAVILRRMRSSPHPWAWWGTRKDPITGMEGVHHDGIDLGEIEGEPVYAVADGVVESCGEAKRGGKYIRIKHDRNDIQRTGYCHLFSHAQWVAVGAPVRRGQIIGYVGHTGATKGDHLHFQTWIFKDGICDDVDPLPLLERSIIEADDDAAIKLADAAKE